MSSKQERHMSFPKGRVEDIQDRAVSELEDYTEEHYDREPTEEERRWAREYVHKQHVDPHVRTPRTPTFTEYRKEFRWPIPEKVLKERGIKPGSMYDPSRS